MICSLSPCRIKLRFRYSFGGLEKTHQWSENQTQVPRSTGCWNPRQHDACGTSHSRCLLCAVFFWPAKTLIYMILPNGNTSHHFMANLGKLYLDILFYIILNLNVSQMTCITMKQWGSVKHWISMLLPRWLCLLEESSHQTLHVRFDVTSTRLLCDIYLYCRCYYCHCPHKVVKDQNYSYFYS